MEMMIVRHNDCLSTAEFARRSIVAALNIGQNQVKAFKRRVMLVKPKASFQSLVETKKFKQLMKILKNDRCNFHSWLPHKSAGNGESAIHLMLKYDPPVEVVGMLLHRMRQIQPEANPATFQDQHDMTPLHIAIAQCCNVRIIELLLSGNDISVDVKNPAGIADCHNRYPLHYICAVPTRLQNRESGKHANPTFDDTLRIIRCLVVSFPAAIDSPDKNGWTAQAMAISLDADEKVLEILQIPSKGLAISQYFSNADEKVRSGNTLHSSVLTPTTCETRDSELGLPFDEIHCYRIRHNDNTDYDDDVSTIGWDCNCLAKNTLSMKQSMKRDELKKQIDILHISLHEINAGNRKQSKLAELQKFMFI